MRLPLILFKGGRTNGARWLAFSVVAHPAWYIALAALVLYAAL